MYLTYAEYQGWGGMLDEQKFERAEFRARLKIDNMTHNRLQDEDPVREVVKRLVFELIESVYGVASDESKYKSVSEGGISITYADNLNNADDLILDFLGSEEDLITPPSPAGIGFARAERV